MRKSIITFSKNKKRDGYTKKSRQSLGKVSSNEIFRITLNIQERKLLLCFSFTTFS